MEEIYDQLLQAGTVGLWVVSLLWKERENQKRQDQQFEAMNRIHEEDKAAMRRVLEMHSGQLERLQATLADVERGVSVISQR